MLPNWDEFFNIVKKKSYSSSLSSFIKNEYSKNKVYPPKDLIFNAFKLTAPNEIKVVLIGQDPYHEKNQAMGLAFSVPDGVNLPPSLINIYKEIENEFHVKMSKSGDLTYLAKQGVLLLNTILTVKEGLPLSHNIEEYKLFITDLLNYIDTLPQHIVFILWGGYAKQFIKFIKNNNRLVLTSVHPSPLSANRGGWFGNNHFIKTNEYLRKNNIKEIHWVNDIDI